MYYNVTIYIILSQYYYYNITSATSTNVNDFLSS